MLLGNGDAVELFEQVGDAAALEHDAAAGDLGGVRGEDGRDADAREQGEGLAGGDAGLAQAAEGSAKVAALGASVLLSWLERRRRLRWLVSARLMSSK